VRKGVLTSSHQVYGRCYSVNKSSSLKLHTSKNIAGRNLNSVKSSAFDGTYPSKPRTHHSSNVDQNLATQNCFESLRHRHFNSSRSRSTSPRTHHSSNVDQNLATQKNCFKLFCHRYSNSSRSRSSLNNKSCCHQFANIKENFLKVKARIHPDAIYNNFDFYVIKNTITVHSCAHGPETPSFTFDALYGRKLSQKDVYEDSTSSAVDDAFNGYHSSIILFGDDEIQKMTLNGYDMLTGENKGILPRALDQLFSLSHNIIAKPGDNKIVKPVDYVECVLRLSCIKIYNEQLYDLLSEKLVSPKQICYLKERRYFVPNVKKHTLRSPEQALQLVLKGLAASNKFIPGHIIFSLHIENTVTNKISHQTNLVQGQLDLISLSKLNESKEILFNAPDSNRSMKSFNVLINELSSNPNHQIDPFYFYNGSKLTQMLSNAIGGNSKTVLIGCVSPTEEYGQVLCTLFNCFKAKSIVNQPTVNKSPIPFTAIHLDIENRHLEEWLNQQAEIQLAILALLEGFEGAPQAEANSCIKAKSHLENKTRYLKGLLEQETKTQLIESQKFLLDNFLCADESDTENHDVYNKDLVEIKQHLCEKFLTILYENRR